MKSSILLFSALCLLCPIAIHAQAPAPSAAAEAGSQVESLRKERREAIQRLVAILENQYRMGIVDCGRVAVANSKLFDLELEMAKSKEERIAACQKQIEACRNLEKISQARFATGMVTEADVLDAKAERLRAEIQLLKEKAQR